MEGLRLPSLMEIWYGMDKLFIINIKESISKGMLMDILTGGIRTGQVLEIL